jgi:hypothetical protein
MGRLLVGGVSAQLSKRPALAGRMALRGSPKYGLTRPIDMAYFADVGR